jgi:plasmid stabilization system protein ParE
MIVEFLAPATTEVEDAVDWYDRQQPGLGEEFRTEVADAVRRIHDSPESCPRISARARRCVLHRFPYVLIYQVLSDRILVLTVVHGKRKPGHWRRRER